MLGICMCVYEQVCMYVYIIIYIYRNANGKNTIQYNINVYTFNIKKNKYFKYKKGPFQKNISFSNIL